MKCAKLSRFLMRILATGALLILVPALTLGASPAASSRQASEPFIVVFHDSVADPAAAAEDLSRRYNARVSFIYRHALKGFAAEIPTRAVDAIARDRRVAYVEEDQLAYAYSLPTGVDRVEADKKTGALDDDSTSVASDVDIAIIDTGIDDTHPDLDVVGGADCSGGSPFRGRCKNGMPGDDNGHGTHVAGTAAAGDNGFGVVGVAPGARLWAVKVLNARGSGYMSWIVAGIDWVTARADQIEVANMSLGCECDSQSLDDAISGSTAEGVVYVVAAGNSAADAATFSPANHPEVIAVSAMTDFDGRAGAAAEPTCRSDVGTDDTFATFSNYGDVVDLAAPGACIWSTVPGGDYAFSSGTSMASPHGAGAAALYIVENNVARSSSRWSTVRDGLRSAGWSVPQGDQCGFTGGRSAEPFLMLAACDSAGS